ncbi:sugar kinase [Rickettsiella grylli]|uniref:2-dehydro-3-deoxygluconokinase n=1 Tax=Rickettsiella grylli TaxID=59196 RepID=A8PKQ1_9COXI|nr:sugar kinase [Rickettsiella grylli]EDP46292.1 2-dehydro-3-deoxygluconokinase (2-keto-3-deoxygluconokinase) (3-deoxy-2-oxo-D-gluconate kinase) (KDG kinase) [Rickettsiella grylli]
MSKMKHIGAIGEAMLELSHQTPTLLSLSYAGDTLNFSIYLCRLLQNQAYKVHYITALGQDFYSEAMLLDWKKKGLQTNLICRIENKLPGLYLIRTDNNGERTFYFYRSNSAARDLFKGNNRNDLSRQLIEMDYLYFSGISLAILDEMSRKYLLCIVEKAKQRGATIIFDSNYRPSLWTNPESAKKVTQDFLKFVDIALTTFIDEQLIFGDTNPEACVQRLLKYGITEIVIKCGSDPALVATTEGQQRVPACPVSRIVDTTAAGDSFNSAYLASRFLGFDPIHASLYGHQLAARVITHPGAIIPQSLMPSLF